MDQTLQQLGELLLGSVPTVILLAVLYALYTASCTSHCRGCLRSGAARLKVRWTNRARTSRRLRRARLSTNRNCGRRGLRYSARRRHAARPCCRLEPTPLNEARSKAQAQVQAAKQDIENDRAEAEKALPAAAAALAQEIVRRVLAPAGAGR